MNKTLISLQKENPDLYVTIPISEYDCLGTSLPFINFNFESIDIALTNLQYSADNFWNEASDYILDNKDRWDSIITDFEQLKDEVEPMLTTVQELSSHWLSPISIIYPYSLLSVDSTTLSSWVNSEYPINPNDLEDQNCWDYIQNQKMYVFALKRTSGSDVYVDRIYGYEFVVSNENWNLVRSLPGY